MNLQMYMCEYTTVICLSCYIKKFFWLQNFLVGSQNDYKYFEAS